MLRPQQQSNTNSNSTTTNNTNKQLSPPRKPLSPSLSKKKKLLQLILNSATPNPNPHPDLKPLPSPPPHLRLHQQHQLLLQQQHFQKQKLLQQQKEQLASELQQKLQQQHRQQLQLQQHHPELAQRFKQHLLRQQIDNSPSDLKSGPVQRNEASAPQSTPNVPRSLRGNRASQRESLESHDGLDSAEEQQKNPVNSRRRVRNELETPPSTEIRKRSRVEEEDAAVADANLCFHDTSHPGKPIVMRPLDGLLPAPVSSPPANGNTTTKGRTLRSAAASQQTRKESEGSGLADSAMGTLSSKPMLTSECSFLLPKKVLRGVLDELQKKDKYGVFSEPVDAEEVPDYYDVIKEPMDFGTMRKRITDGYYINLDLFEKDIFKICNNAMTFNAAGTIYYRHARTIKIAAEKCFEDLKAKSSARDVGNDSATRQKTSTKRSHKKKVMPNTSVDKVSLDHAKEANLRTGQPSADCDMDIQAESASSQIKLNGDNKEDSPGNFMKSIDFRRFFLNEESRRNTFKPQCMQGRDSLIIPSLQFVPAASQVQFSYARSLARYAADLGPAVWKVASNKIRRSLPPGVPFGPGWVAERGLSFSKSHVAQRSDVHFKAGNMLNQARSSIPHDKLVAVKGFGGPDANGNTHNDSASVQPTEKGVMPMSIQRLVPEGFTERVQDGQLHHLGSSIDTAGLLSNDLTCKSLSSVNAEVDSDTQVTTSVMDKSEDGKASCLAAVQNSQDIVALYQSKFLEPLQNGKVAIGS